MFSDLFNRLTGAAPQFDPEPDYKHALAALLVRCAKADADYSAQEQAVIDAVLTARYSFSAADAATLRREGEALEAEAGDTVHLTKAVKDGVPYEERFAVIEALWRVVLADDTRDYQENAFLRLVAKLLGLTDVESGQARKAAEAAPAPAKPLNPWQSEPTAG